MGTAQSTAIRLHAVGTGQAVPLPYAAQQNPPPRVVSPVPTLRQPTHGILPLTSACERGGGGAGGAAFPRAGAGGREAPAGLMGCEGGPGGGVGDRREGNASWVALSESCSDLQPGGRCCRRQRQRSPTPPGAASLFDCSRKKKGAGFAGLPFLWATELRPHSTAVPGRPRPAPSPDRASHYYSSQHRRCCSAGLGSLLGFVACSRR